VGFSDHTKGINAALTAGSLGAKVIEKHIVLNKKIKTVDSFFSSDPQEFKLLVSGIREVEKAIGKISYNISKGSLKNLSGRKSIYIIKKIKKKEKFTENNIRCVRPSYGLHPKYFKWVIGKKSKKNLYPGDRLSFQSVIKK
jgi:Sialic acid synthase